jgi:hypothetical protein
MDALKMMMLSPNPDKILPPEVYAIDNTSLPNRISKMSVSEFFDDSD